MQGEPAGRVEQGLVSLVSQESAGGWVGNHNVRGLYTVGDLGVLQGERARVHQGLAIVAQLSVDGRVGKRHGTACCCALNGGRDQWAKRGPCSFILFVPGLCV